MLALARPKCIDDPPTDEHAQEGDPVEAVAPPFVLRQVVPGPFSTDQSLESVALEFLALDDSPRKAPREAVGGAKSQLDIPGEGLGVSQGADRNSRSGAPPHGVRRRSG